MQTEFILDIIAGPIKSGDALWPAGAGRPCPAALQTAFCSPHGCGVRRWHHLEHYGHAAFLAAWRLWVIALLTLIGPPLWS